MIGTSCSLYFFRMRKPDRPFQRHPNRLPPSVPQGHIHTKKRDVRPAFVQKNKPHTKRCFQYTTSRRKCQAFLRFFSLLRKKRDLLLFFYKKPLQIFVNYDKIEDMVSEGTCFSEKIRSFRRNGTEKAVSVLKRHVKLIYNNWCNWCVIDHHAQ